MKSNFYLFMITWAVSTASVPRKKRELQYQVQLYISVVLIVRKVGTLSLC